MTTTDVLRRLLDERGVEWTMPLGIAGHFSTSWCVGPWEYEAVETSGGGFSIYAKHRYRLTPKQAVGTTLERGTCHDKGNIERFICSECGCRLNLQDEDWEPTMWLDGAAMVPHYCPNCGRKVIS